MPNGQPEIAVFTNRLLARAQKPGLGRHSFRTLRPYTVEAPSVPNDGTVSNMLFSDTPM